MIPISRRRAVIMLAGGLLLLPGCGPARKGIHGQVTLDGQPLDEAAILFVPADAGRKKTGAGIVSGSYDLPAADGLLPGVYRVEIADNPPLDSMSHAKGAAQQISKRRALPPGYSRESPLRIEISADERGTSREANYDLKSQ